LTHVATDNWAAGELAGKALGEAMKGQGKFAILGAVQGVKNNRDRSDGAASYIAKNFPGMKLVTIRYTDNDLNNSLAITSDIITANPDIGGFFSNNETTTIAVSIVLNEKGKVGKIKHIGFDATAQTVGSLKGGVTSAIVTQVPFKMGYVAVQSAFDASKGKALPAVTDTGVALVTMENVNSPEIQKILNPLK
jgi:ribose transport system substrate-binding protein